MHNGMRGCLGGVAPDRFDAVVLIDAGVDGGEALVPAAGTVRIIHPSDGDPLEAMARALAGHSGLEAIHVVCHGAPGELLFAGGRVDAARLAERAEALARIAAALAPDGDILLHACETGAGAAGRAFVDALAEATGANVAAASRPVGAEARGGTWTLDVAAGAVAAHGFPDAAARSAFTGLLSASEPLTDWNDVDPGLIGFSGGDFNHTLSNGWTASVDVVSFPSGSVELAVFGDDGANGVGGSFPNTDSNGDNHLAAYSTSGNDVAGLRIDFDTAFELGGFYVHFREDGEDGSMTIRRVLYREGGGSVVSTFNLERASDGEFHWHFNDTAGVSSLFGPFTGISFSRTDGGGFSYVAIDDLQPPPMPPVVTAPGTTPTFTENGTPVLVDTGLTVDDPEDDAITGATVSITGNFQAETDVLAVTDGSGITSSYDAQTGVLTLNGTSTEADYQAVLRTLTFASTSEDPSADQRTLTIEVSDASGSGSATQTVDVTPVDDPTTISAPGSGATYTEGENWVVVDDGFTIEDPDSVPSQIQSATIEIRSGGEVGSDELMAPTGSYSITSTFDPDTLTLTLAGPAAAPLYQDVLDSLRFRSTGEDPSEGAREILYTVVPVSGPEMTATQTVTVTAVNDAPSITKSNVTPIFREDGQPVAIGETIALADPEGDDLTGATVSITGGHAANADVLSVTEAHGITSSFDAASGVITLAGTATLAQYEEVLGSLMFSTTSQDPSGQRTLTYAVTDEGGATGSFAQDSFITPVNDAPTLTGLPETVSATEDTTASLDFSAVTFADVDSGNETVRLTLEASAGTLASVSGAGVTVTGASTATLHLDGTASAIDAYLDANTIAYTPAADATADATIAFAADDNGHSGAGDAQTPTFGTVTVTIESVNDDPVLYSLDGPNRVVMNTVPVVLDEDVRVADAELDALADGAGDHSGASLTLARHGGASAEDVFSVVSGAGFTVSGDDIVADGNVIATIARPEDGAITITFADNGTTPTTALVNAVLRAIHYQYTGDTAQSVSFDWTYEDGNTGSQGSGGAGSTLALMDVDLIAPIVVTTGEDVVDASDGETSLREAVEVANHANGFDAIVFAPALADATLTLTSALSVTDPVIVDGDVDGDGRADVTLDGDGATRHFEVSAPYAALDLRHLVLQNGSADTGGSVQVGTLTALLVDGVTFEDNVATGNGGAVAIGPGALARVTDSLFLDNAASMSDGGSGGAIHLNGSSAVLVNVTITGNEAYYGAGIGVRDSAVEIHSSTIAGNSGHTYMGFYAEEVSGGVADGVTLYNSIVTGNDGSHQYGFTTGYAGTVAGGNNLLGWSHPSLSTDSVETDDPGLAPLADNGGPVRTMMPTAFSPAVNAGTNDEVHALTAANGAPRVLLGTVDIGAAELATATPAVDLNASADGTGFTGSAIEGTPAPIAAETVTVVDIDDDPVTGVTITLTGRPDGAAEGLAVSGAAIDALTGGTGAADLSGVGEIALTDLSATSDAVETFLAAVTFTNTADDPTGDGHTVTVTLTDEDGVGEAATATFSMTNVNDAPVIDGLFMETETTVAGATNVPLTIADDVTVTDPDSQDFAGGSLTILSAAPVPDAIVPAVGDPDPGDPDPGDGAWGGRWRLDGIGATAGDDGAIAGGEAVAVGGTVIGTVSNTDDGAPGHALVIDFNGEATPARVSDLLRALVFDAPSSADARFLPLVVDDGDGDAHGGESAGTAAIGIVATSRPPSIEGITGAAPPVGLAGEAVPVAGGGTVTVTDPDSATLGEGLLRIERDSALAGDFSLGSAPFAVGETVTVGGTDLGTVTADGQDTSALAIALAATATPALVADFLGALAYTGDERGAHDFTVSLRDGAADAPSGTSDPVSFSVMVRELPEIALSPTLDGIAEDADTSARIAVADLVVTSDGLGSVSLGLDGPDAALFEIDGARLFLRAGADLDRETNPILDVTLTGDDPAIPGAPDASANLSITVTEAAVPPADDEPADPPSNDDPWADDDDDPSGDGDLFTGPDGTRIDDGVALPLEPTDTFENTTFGGASATRGTTRDTVTGETVEVLAVNPGSGERTEGGIGDVALSLPGGFGFIAVSRTESDPAGLSHLIDPLGSELEGDLAHFLGGTSGPRSVTQIIPVAPAGSGTGPLHVDAGTTGDGIVVIDLTALSPQTQRTVTVSGTGPIVVVGDATVTGEEGLTIHNLFQGGAGAQTVMLGAGEDTLSGGSGDDTVGSAAGRDLILGGSGADSLTGGAHRDTLAGQSGDDTAHGGTGADALYGGPGADHLFGETGNDALFGGGDEDTLAGGEGRDALNPGAGDDLALGGAGGDRFAGAAGADTLAGQGGDDTVRGGRGDDTLQGGAGDDVLNGQRGNDHAVGGAGADTLAGAQGDDTLAGREGHDALFGGDGDDALFGHEGDDRLAGRRGNDHLRGDEGADTLAGGTGEDTLKAGAGDDLLEGGAGRDALHGGMGADTLVGGRGADRFAFASSFGDDVVADFQSGTDAVVFAGIGSDAVIVRATDEGLLLDAGAHGTVLLAGLAETANPEVVFI